MEAGLSLRACRMQSHPRRFPRRSRQAISEEIRKRRGQRAFLLHPARTSENRRTPCGLGLLELRRGRVELLNPAAKNLRTATGFRYEMNLLLASLRRVELRIEPQSITDF